MPGAQKLHIDPLLIRIGTLVMVVGFLIAAMSFAFPERPAALGVFTGVAVAVMGALFALPVRGACAPLNCRKPSHRG